MKVFLGQRFGLLIVRASLPRQKGKHPKWQCKCNCGQFTEADEYNMKNGHTQSCGCLRKSVTIARNTTHGMASRDLTLRPPEYRVWKGIRSRILRPNDPLYVYYGGRGIALCDRWKESFINFLTDMGPRPSPQHSIERRDNNGPYAPENCEWAIMLTQANNRRNNRILNFRGEALTMAQWGRRIGIPAATIRARLYDGWSIELILTSPVRHRPVHLLTYQDNTLSVSEWARKTGIGCSTLFERLRRGWPIERVLIK